MATPSLEFSENQRESIKKLVLFMRLAAVSLLLLAAVLVVVGGIQAINGALGGLKLVIQGAVSVILGLILMTSAADVEFTITTKYTEVHVGNALENLGVLYKFQLGLAAFLVVIGVLQALFSGVPAAVGMAVVVLLAWPALALAGTPAPREGK